MFAAAAHYTHSLVRKRGNNNNCLLTSPRNDPKAFTFDPKRLERVRSAAARAESERRRKEVEIERRLDREEAAAAGFEKERLSQAIEQATFGGRGKQHALSSIFGKTYYELQGWTHVFHVFGGHAFR